MTGRAAAWLIASMLVLAGTVSTMRAQEIDVDLNAELTASKFDPDKDPWRKVNTNFREDDPFNPLRAKLFVGAEFTDWLGLEAEVLFDSRGIKFDRSGDQPVRIDGLFVSIRNVVPGALNFWFGRVPTPVGQFSARSYSHVNPLIGYPLAYHYKLPYNVFTLSSEPENLALRDAGYGAATTIYEACWMDGGSAFGTIAGFDYMLTVSPSSLTNPEAKQNGGVQVAGRVGREFGRFAAGISGGIAPYLEHGENLPAGIDVTDPQHILAGLDGAARFGSLDLHVEAFYNSWETPQYAFEKSVQAYAWYLEAKFTLVPEFYAAARFDQMIFSDITDPGGAGAVTWAYDVHRIEGGIGYSPVGPLNVKAVIQQWITGHPETGFITILALQGAFRFSDVQDLWQD